MHHPKSTRKYSTKSLIAKCATAAPHKCCVFLTTSRFISTFLWFRHWMLSISVKIILWNKMINYPQSQYLTIHFMQFRSAKCFLEFIKCGLVWQKGTYSLPNRVTLWPHRIKRLKYISLKFSQITLLCCWSLVCKMHWHRPCRKKVMSSQSQRSGKAISPFLSDRVTNIATYFPTWKDYLISYWFKIMKDTSSRKLNQKLQQYLAEKKFERLLGQ